MENMKCHVLNASASAVEITDLRGWTAMTISNVDWTGTLIFAIVNITVEGSLSFYTRSKIHET